MSDCEAEIEQIIRTHGYEIAELDKQLAEADAFKHIAEALTENVIELEKQLAHKHQGWTEEAAAHLETAHREAELDKQLAEIKLRGIKQGLRMSEAEQREARLREALEKIKRIAGSQTSGLNYAHCNLNIIEEKARAALEDESKNPHKTGSILENFETLGEEGE